MSSSPIRMVPTPGSSLASKTVKRLPRYALEFCVYSICVPRASRSGDPQMREFLRWQIERVLGLYKASGARSDYLERLRLNDDAAELRQYMRDYFGQLWTTTTLGF